MIIGITIAGPTAEKRTSGSPKVALSAAIVMSHSMTNSHPPPSTWPCTAATTGFFKGDIVRHRQSLAPVPTSAIQDHYGMGIGGDLAADLAEMMVHRDGIADWHDQRRRFALQWADRTKHIGRAKAEVTVPPAGCRFAPTPGSGCFSGR